MEVQDASINISGGKIIVNAEGDGIDSNGNLTVSGGETYVSGPTKGGNGGIDYNGTATITGGTFIVTAVESMEMNFGSASTQGSALVSVGSQSAGTTVSISDSKGDILASYTPSKSYSSVLISTAGMTQGETYTITAGSTKQEVTLTEFISGNGNGGFNGNNNENNNENNEGNPWGRPDGAPSEDRPGGNWGSPHGGMHNPPEWNNEGGGFENNENNNVKQNRKNKDNSKIKQKDTTNQNSSNTNNGKLNKNKKICCSFVQYSYLEWQITTWKKIINGKIKCQYK
ncbi:MAG: hypothetical protein ACTTKP_05940 [Catonella sp.]|uniref:hypothetical protein n=1 Tax=Catonella sp. TaxID=2382125 RepID=UPI003FA06963